MLINIHDICRRCGEVFGKIRCNVFGHREIIERFYRAWSGPRAQGRAATVGHVQFCVYMFDGLDMQN